MLPEDYKCLCTLRIHMRSSVIQSINFGVLRFIYLLQDSVCGLFIRNLPFSCVLCFGVIATNIRVLSKVKCSLLLNIVSKR